jgi:hypothetical protein
VWTGGEWDGVDGVVDNSFGVAYYLLLDGGVVGNACSVAYYLLLDGGVVDNAFGVAYYLLLDGVNTVAICV